MAYINKVFCEGKVVKRIFALVIILFLSMVMVNGVGCEKKVETKKVTPQKTVQDKENAPVQSQDKKMEGNISEELVQDISEEKKESAELKASTSFIYDPEDRQDPFIPLIVKKTQDAKETKVVQNAPPLESFDVKEFRLIATAVSTTNEFFALLLAPDKKSYTVTEGAKLGFHMGKIKEISMNEIIVEEYEEDHLNELKMRRVTLKLRRDDS